MGIRGLAARSRAYVKGLGAPIRSCVALLGAAVLFATPAQAATITDAADTFFNFDLTGAASSSYPFTKITLLYSISSPQATGGSGSGSGGGAEGTTFPVYVDLFDAFDGGGLLSTQTVSITSSGASPAYAELTLPGLLDRLFSVGLRTFSGFTATGSVSAFATYYIPAEPGSQQGSSSGTTSIYEGVLGGSGPGTDPTPVPEPATLSLFALGMLGVAALRGRKAAKS